MVTDDDVRRVVEAAERIGWCPHCMEGEESSYIGWECSSRCGKTYQDVFIVPAPLFRELAAKAGCEVGE